MKRWMVAAALVATVGSGAVSIADATADATVAKPQPDGVVATYQADSVECDVLRQINAFRRKQGKPALALSAPLGDAARHHSEDMAAKDYFSHTLKGGTNWDENIRDFGYRGDPVGENIAAGQKTADEVVKAWRESKGHRKNMLDGGFRAIGIARAYDEGSKYDWYWTTTFGGKVEREVSCG